MIGQPTSLPHRDFGVVFWPSPSISTTRLCMSRFRCRDSALAPAADSELYPAFCDKCQACTPTPRVSYLLPGKEGRTRTVTWHHGQEACGHVETNEKRVQVMPS